MSKQNAAKGGPAKPDAQNPDAHNPDAQNPPADDEQGGDDEQEAAEPMAKLNGNGNAACNVFGVEYTADKDGMFEVPARAVEHLKTHGFTPA